MTEKARVSIWLSSQADVASELTYAQKGRLKEGDHTAVVAEYVDKLRSQARWGRILAGVMGGMLFLTGLYSWAVEFGLVAAPADSGTNFRGFGTLLVFGAVAISTMFRVAQLERRVTQFETGIAMDAYFASAPGTDGR